MRFRDLTFSSFLFPVLWMAPLPVAADIRLGDVYQSGFDENLHIDLPAVRIDESPDSAVQVLHSDPQSARLRLIRGRAEVSVAPDAAAAVFETPSGTAELSSPGSYVLALQDNGTLNVQVLTGRARMNDGRRSAELYAGDSFNSGGGETIYVNSQPAYPEPAYTVPEQTYAPPPPVMYPPALLPVIDVPLFGFGGRYEHRESKKSVEQNVRTQGPGSETRSETRRERHSSFSVSVP